MPYKDKEKQKKANREASQRQRDKVKGMTTEGMTEQGMTTPTGSTCNSFLTLPLDIQEQINTVTSWCKARGIPDDRQARIDRAIYQQNIRKDKND